jgi:hypothetical protein
MELRVISEYSVSEVHNLYNLPMFVLYPLETVYTIS